MFADDACRTIPVFVFVILGNTRVMMPDFALVTLYHINSILGHQCQSEKEAEMQKMKKEMDDLKRKVKECQLDEDGFRDDDEKVNTTQVYVHGNC